MSNLPPCGIYKTRVALSGKDEWVRENLLVYFHNHSQQGPPLVLLPAANSHNRWTFHDKGYLVKDDEFAPGLLELLPEGYYILNEAIFLSHDESIPPQTLVQLGYNRAADPILFLSQFDDNTIHFPANGLKCTLEIFDLLRPVDFRTPEVKDQH
jgi:hypothetical protein